MDRVRPPAVAGKFYPGDANRLKRSVANFIKQAKDLEEDKPKAIIAPHAGYIYSGPIAGTAYASLAPWGSEISRVILLGPSHWVMVGGLATSGVDAFATPLGKIPLDKKGREQITSLPQVVILDRAHEQEHGLEVHLPFLQHIISEFSVIPLVVGQASSQEVAEVLEKLWDGPSTIIVISSDLSHYQDYLAASRLDRSTSANIEAFEPLREGQACGGKAINGLLHVAKRRGMRVRTVDLRNSGDTAGPRDRVVGYGAWLFFD